MGRRTASSNQAHLGRTGIQVLVLLAAFAIPPGPAASTRESESLGSRLARAAVVVNDRSEFVAALTSLDPAWQHPSWALKPILGDISEGGGSELHWRALRRLDSWGDGVWSMEFSAACYDAVVAGPDEYLKAYRGGNDMALVVVVKALKWPVELLDVEIGCDSSKFPEMEVLDEGVMRIEESLYRQPSTPSSDPRGLVLLEVVAGLISRWTAAKNWHPTYCGLRQS